MTWPRSSGRILICTAMRSTWAIWPARGSTDLAQAGWPIRTPKASALGENDQGRTRRSPVIATSRCSWAEA